MPTDNGKRGKKRSECGMCSNLEGGKEKAIYMYNEPVDSGNVVLGEQDS